MNLNYYYSWTTHSLHGFVDCNWTDWWLSGRSQKSGSFLLVSSPYMRLRGVGIWFLFIPSFLPCMQKAICMQFGFWYQWACIYISLSLCKKEVCQKSLFVHMVECKLCHMLHNRSLQCFWSLSIYISGLLVGKSLRGFISPRSYDWQYNTVYVIFFFFLI